MDSVDATPRASMGKPTAFESDHAKWVVGMVSAALVGALAWFVASDRNTVGATLLMHTGAIGGIAQVQAVHEYRIQEQADRSKRIEGQLDLILERLPKKGR